MDGKRLLELAQSHAQKEKIKAFIQAIQKKDFPLQRK
jgi:hypothetical protein